MKILLAALVSLVALVCASSLAAASSSGHVVASNDCLSGTLRLQLEKPDSESQFWLSSVSGLTANQVGLTATITYDDETLWPKSSCAPTQEAMLAADFFSARPILLHVDGHVIALASKPQIQLDPVPNGMNGYLLYCWHFQNNKCTPGVANNYYAPYTLSAPLTLTKYAGASGEHQVWFSTPADDGTVVESDQYTFTRSTTGPTPITGGGAGGAAHLTVTSLGGRSVKVTLTSTQLHAATTATRLLFLAERASGGTWVTYPGSTKVVQVRRGATSPYVVFTLPKAGRWSFEARGMVKTASRPIGVYAGPRYLVVR